MGWTDVAVLVADPSAGDWESGPHVPHVLGLDAAAVATIEPANLRDRLAAGNTVVIDLDTSRRYGQGHIPGAWFAMSASVPAMVLAGGTEAWAGTGLPLEMGATRMASEPEDVVLSARERGQGREAAMREYLAWEIDLVNQMASDDDHRFRVVTV